jgi:DNA-binding beta-propeller fold protein YncE
MTNKSSSMVSCVVSALIGASASSAAMAGASTEFPTYTVGPQSNGSYLMSTGQIITPAGTVINLTDNLTGTPSPVRAKAVALNPVNHNYAAVLLMGASSAVDVINLSTGKITQQYVPFKDKSGAFTGISYSSDGAHLLFSQDNSFLAVANVDPTTDNLSDNTHVALAASNAAINCSGVTEGLPSDPVTGLCGKFYTGGTANPSGVAVSADNKTAYVLLNQNNTMQAVDLTTVATNGSATTKGAPVPVGNAPNSVVTNGQYVYVTNEGGRVATPSDFTNDSAGTPIVANQVNGSAVTGTISVYDTTKGIVVANIETGGRHPTSMTVSGSFLFVMNTGSENIGVIDLRTNRLMRTISVALPLPGDRDDRDDRDGFGNNGFGHDGHDSKAFGAQPTSMAVVGSVAYVSLYTINAIAVVDLSGGADDPVLGYIPTASTPASIAYDAAHNQLVVANDKGLGAQSNQVTSHGAGPAYNTHEDVGTVSLIPLPNFKTLKTMTAQVSQNNHWDLQANIEGASGGNPWERAVAIPKHIGDPSKIKHVFLIVRENRTYDQVLGDVKAGNGEPSLAVFAPYTPNVHNLVTRFPLLDNYYNPSRQSADGHNWLVQGMAPYMDEIQSPDWVRSYPANAQDSLAYQPKGFVWDAAEKKGLSVKIYGEYVEYAGVTFKQPNGATTEPSWNQFYNDTLAYESGTQPQLTYATTVNTISEIPSVQKYSDTHFPVFDLGIPDQFRVDLWQQDFNKDVTAGKVPSLETLWIMCDHTGGPPGVAAEQADNDLAIGRIIDTITHSPAWKDSVIFVTEDDAQDGVDHIDGHRSPGYVVSPYVIQAQDQGGQTVVNHTAFTQVNMTRTIEQILGLPPMNQFDLVASPMSNLFTDNPPESNFAPWNHVAATVPLCTTGASATAPFYTGVLSGYTIVNGACVPSATTAKNLRKLKPIEKAWAQAKNKIFNGKQHIPDSEDPVVVNHWVWYEATGYSRPYPGEAKVLWPAAFRERISAAKPEIDD